MMCSKTKIVHGTSLSTGEHGQDCYCRLTTTDHTDKICSYFVVEVYGLIILA